MKIQYPASLPGPVAAPIQSAERRLLSSLPGPRESRANQRDRLASQPVDFIFTHDELAIFTAWLDSTFVREGAWFSAEWPQPQGGIGVRRFIGAPSYPVYHPALGWRVSAVCEVRGRGMVPVASCDPFFDDVLLRLHFDKGFVDSSSYHRSVTGSAVISPTRKFGAGAAMFSGAGTALAVAQPFTLTADLTIDFWCFPTSLQPNGQVFWYFTDQPGTAYWYAAFVTDGAGVKFTCSIAGSTVQEAGWPHSLGQWHHIGIQRRSGTTTLFVDGKWIGNAINTGELPLLGATLRLGGNAPNLGNPYFGALDEFAVTAAARYSGDFEPPGRPLGDWLCPMD